MFAHCTNSITERDEKHELHNNTYLDIHHNNNNRIAELSVERELSGFKFLVVACTDINIMSMLNI